MGMCFVPDCKHYSERERCRFYRFPLNENEKKIWIRNIRRYDKLPSKYSKVCSCHFKDNLKANGPTIFNENRNKITPPKKKRQRFSAFIKSNLCQNVDSSNQPAKIDEELVTMKLELDEAYTEIYALKREKDQIMEEIESLSVKCKTLEDSAPEPVKKIENVKLELQQAYKEINSLREEKKELQKKVSSSNLTDSILQDASQLNFYTGLNSVKDVQSVLALICDVDSNVKCIPMVTQLLIALMKLKLNLFNSDLAYRFQISHVTVRKIIEKIIPPLEAKLDSLVKCPINNALKKNIPQYKNTVYENLYEILNKNSKSKAKQIENEEISEETVSSL